MREEGKSKIKRGKIKNQKGMKAIGYGLLAMGTAINQTIIRVIRAIRG